MNININIHVACLGGGWFSLLADGSSNSDDSKMKLLAVDMFFDKVCFYFLEFFHCSLL